MHIATPRLSFDFTISVWIVLALSGLAGSIILVRRPPAPRLTFALGLLGLILLALAAGKPTWNKPSDQTVAVMVDLSASTRTAKYRDRVTLERRIHELLRDVPYRIEFFADGTRPIDRSIAHLPDLPSDRTTYTPPAAAAVLLFSDCRFPLPEQSPPTYVCVDIGLEDPPDAAVENLEIRGSEAAVSFRNSGGPRKASFEGIAATPTTLPAGSIVVSRPLAPGVAQLSAELAPGDPWPENDALRAIVPPPEKLERWWVGRSPATNGWRAIDPRALPTDASEYLKVGVIVLDDVSASDMSDLQQQRLEQYVRDLGGGVLILGGDHAFAAGGYDGTPIDALSPLASNPPLPTTHWILLADASGSMSETVPGGTKWKYVTDAIVSTLPRLPPDDVASVGSFAESLQWWLEGKPVRDAATTPFPPANAYPHGPTNLQPALESIAHSVDGKMPVQLLVLSDFDTHVVEAPELTELLNLKKIHLHLLAIGQGTALPILGQVAARTSGSVMTELDPSRWSSAARELARTAGTKLVRHETVRVSFRATAGGLAAETANLWNRVWLKPQATLLAETSAGHESLPMIAQWNIGEGRVTAAAFSPRPAATETLAGRVAAPPRDPRFHVSWETGNLLRVAVDAIVGTTYLNSQDLEIDWGGSSHQLPQTGPGRYELEIEAPTSPAIATLRAGGRVLERIALAGRYAPEFDAIGNDLSAMRELAGRSGGAVIPPNQGKPIEIHWPPRRVSMVPEIAIAGAFFIGLALIVWRRTE